MNWRSRKHGHALKKKAQRDAIILAAAKKSAWAGVTWHEWYYDFYLLSDEWKEKRALVLERDRHVCQGCLKRQATVVHHMSYKDVELNNAHEMLFDLISLCETCHERLHGRQLKGAWK